MMFALRSTSQLNSASLPTALMLEILSSFYMMKIIRCVSLKFNPSKFGNACIIINEISVIGYKCRILPKAPNTNQFVSAIEKQQVDQ
jgi:hypothetical protein